MALDICGPDGIRNFFVRAQHNLDQEFAFLEGPMGIWDQRIRNLGAFPLSSGWAARVTTLGFKRPRLGQMTFNPLVGLQEDCKASCDSPAQEVAVNSADNLWYRMMQHVENTEVFCLLSMWGDALNLTEQLQNIIRVLRDRTSYILDEFKRSNYTAIAFNKWLGYTGAYTPQTGLWRFAEDANGQPNVDYIIVDAGIDPASISLPTIPLLNFIIESGSYYSGTFPADGLAEFITDFETREELPKFDTNTRADNRFREPSVLNPRLGVTGFGRPLDYAGIRMYRDPFLPRYIWTEDDPLFPEGVFKRVDPWIEDQVSLGCWDAINPAYMRADFQLSPFYNDNVFGMQDMNLPTNLPGGSYDQPQSPYNGMWRFINEINEITPCNVDRNKAFWRMTMRMAAKPLNSGRLGHVLFHRRFGTAGPVASCRPLEVSAGSYFVCDESCPPFDFFPPPLANPQTCGTWNAEALGCSEQP